MSAPSEWDEDDWYEFAAKESKECNYVVSIGHTYCRECGGGGSLPENAWITCLGCNGLGEHQHPDWSGDVDRLP